MNARAKILQFRRAELEARIEEMIALLDTLDGDPDLEDGADDEPNLGSHPKYRNGRLEYDLEGDTADEEPSLGWSEHLNQAAASRLSGFIFGPDLEQDVGRLPGGCGL
ncbi:hypothetical protein DEM27_28755 [Metarhizobium album]|uniref:Uncharacterized protein n=1 Tax=Metarhizobium album TaxID=2182425 RepID=A0A2U2DHJ3_9HYPH|nr:hypothetical protein [Rhizobium album]PWE52795.1 hypothetical protein DEM27_28755 [Rhizobium album]